MEAPHLFSYTLPSVSSPFGHSQAVKPVIVGETRSQVLRAILKNYQTLGVGVVGLPHPKFVAK